jgi:mannitol-1-phosphate 5-dehydrogenase
MPLTGHRTFVGFGFGAIQAGLFLYEAFQSGNFSRLVAAEVDPKAVAEIRANSGRFAVNIAHPGRVETAAVGPIEIENPNEPADLGRLIDAVAAAEEMATAVPSVKFFKTEGPGSIHRILAEGLRKKVRRGGPRAVVYAAENHNHAAEILEAAVFEGIPAEEAPAVRARVRFLNTVIGKMSGVVSLEEGAASHLARVTPSGARVFLVEEFNRILITRIAFPPAVGEGSFERGFSIFAEKPDLLPFEEAKLYGHNAAHALAAYLCAFRGYTHISDLRRDPQLLEFIRAAFIEESGAALVRAHAGIDPLFTPQGFKTYAEDLLERMTNPFLHDTVERVARDPKRKLGWDDRLIGTMRLALRHSVAPHRFALGAAAALNALDSEFVETSGDTGALLRLAWGDESSSSPEPRQIVSLIDEAKPRLQGWRQSDFKELRA